MPDTMLASVLHGRRDLRFEARPIPTPGPDDALVSVRSVGVCGSDLHFWDSGRVGSFEVRSPFVLGHESAGVVVEVGSAVKSLKPGDRVALEPGVPCRRCRTCLSGRYNLCPNVFFMATPPDDGAFVEYLTHPADFCFRLPDHVSLDEGAMMEPLSVGLHAVRRAGIGAGSRVLITGSGTIGLTALLAARAAGATQIMVSDVNDARLRRALATGASAVVNSKTTPVADFVRDSTDGEGVDVVIECSGAQAATNDGVASIRRGGVIVVVGLGRDMFELPLWKLIGHELDVRGVHRYTNTYPAAINLVASGQIRLKHLVTHHFSLSDVEKAMETAHTDLDNAVKVMVHPSMDRG